MDRLIQELFEDANGLINIREFKDKKCKRKHFFTLQEFQNYQPPQDREVFFGVYARTRRPGTEKNCSTIKCLYLDFDYMDIDAVKKRISDAGLPQPSVYVSSGHGVHTYWLLEERTNNTVALLRQMQILTGADNTADTPRVMRLPGTMNTKREPVPCKVIEGDYRKYNRALFDELIPIVTEQAPPPIMKGKAPRSKINIPELMNSKRYCISQMANGAKEGHRNFIQGRLIKYLQMQGKTKEQTEDIIINWNRNNEPPIPEGQLLRDFNSYWKADYLLLGCLLKNEELQSLQEYCNPQKCNINNGLKGSCYTDASDYNNIIFDDKFHKWNGNQIIIYGILLRHREGLTTSQLKQKLTARITGKLCMTEKTLTKYIKSLIKRNLIRKITTKQRCNGKEYLYQVIPQNTFGTGYTLLKDGALNGAIDGRVKPAELKLYLMLMKYEYGKGYSYPSYITLANNLQVSKQFINTCMKNLEKWDYIKSQSRMINGNNITVYELKL